MSELSKTQLTAENNSNFPNNNTGFITPEKLRTFNQDMIDSMVDEQTYNVDSSSFSGSIAMLETQVDALVLSGSGVVIQEEGTPLGSATALNFVGASVTASLVGAVATINVNATATDLSGLNQFTASQESFNSAATASIVALQDFSSSLDATFATDAELNASSSTLQANIDTKLSTASFNDFSSSVSGEIDTLQAEVDSLQSVTGSYATTGSNTFNGDQLFNGSLNVTGDITASKLLVQVETASIIFSSGSNQFGDAADDVQTLYGSVRVVNELTASKLQVNGVTDLNGVLDVSNDATFRGDLYIQQSTNPKIRLRDTAGGGHSDGFDIQISTSSFVITDETHDINFFEFDYDGVSQHTLKLEANRFELNSGSLGVSGSFTSSLAEGYVWVGGVGNVSTAISTASLVVSVDTGSFATTASNTFIGNQIISGNLLVSGANINLEVDAPALSIGVTNVKTVLDATASGVVTTEDIYRTGAGPTGDLSGVRLQTLSGSDTTGDTLLSRVSTGVNRNTSTQMTGSVVNTTILSQWATGSLAGRVTYGSTITANAQSASATLTFNAGNAAQNFIGGTASFNSGFIRIGSAQAHRVEVTGSVRIVGNTNISGSLNVSSSLTGDDGNLIRGGVTIVAGTNNVAVSIKSGSFELTTPQGSGSFYSNCPITSSGLRINGTALVADLIVSGVFGGNSSLQVTANASVTQSLYVGGQLDVNSIGGARGLSITGSNPTITNGSLSGSLIGNLGSIYTASIAPKNLVTLGSASMATLLSGAGTDANTIYFVI